MKASGLLFAVVASSLFPPVVAATKYVAHPCAGCTEAQFEQTAIGKGLGFHYLYDFPRKQFRKYEVIREPNGNGNYRYEANLQSVEAEAMALFNKAEYVYSTGGGTLTRSVVLTLPQAVGAGNHANDSAFDLARTNGGAKQFGDWLAQYLQSQNIPADAAIGTKELEDLRRANPAITFTGKKMRIHVRVKFKDGEAELEITEDEQSYNLKALYDDQGNPIPRALDQARGIHYDFDDPNSAAARGFESLFLHWGVPIGTGGWRCGVAVGGDGRSITCIFPR